MAEERTHADAPEQAKPQSRPHAPEIDLADEEGFPPKLPIVPPVALPPVPAIVKPPAAHVAAKRPQPFKHTLTSRYWYDGKTQTQHRVLGLLEPGENQFPTDEAVMVDALRACVAEGLLRQL